MSCCGIPTRETGKTWAFKLVTWWQSARHEDLLAIALAERTSAASQRKDRRSSIGRWYRRTRRRTSTVRPRTRRLTPGPIVSAQVAKGATNRRMPFTMHRGMRPRLPRHRLRCSSTFLDFAIHRYQRINQHHGPIDRESCHDTVTSVRYESRESHCRDAVQPLLIARAGNGVRIGLVNHDLKDPLRGVLVRAGQRQ